MIQENLFGSCETVLKPLKGFNSKKNKIHNREDGIYLLEKHGVPFKKFDDKGIHVRVLSCWNVWPSTSLCHNIETGEKFRGVDLLIKRLGYDKKK